MQQNKRFCSRVQSDVNKWYWYSFFLALLARCCHARNPMRVAGLSRFSCFQIAQIKLKLTISSTKIFHLGCQGDAIKCILTKIKHVPQSYLYKVGHEVELTLCLFVFQSVSLNMWTKGKALLIYKTVKMAAWN